MLQKLYTATSSQRTYCLPASPTIYNEFRTHLSLEKDTPVSSTCDWSNDQIFSKQRETRVVKLSRATTRLSGWLVDLGDRVRLLHTRYRLGHGHQHGRLGGLDGASCGNGQRDGSHALIVRDIGDDGEIVVTEAIPTTDELTPDGLAGRTAHGFNSVLRLLQLGGYRFCSVGCLIHVKRHVSISLVVVQSVIGSVGSVVPHFLRATIAPAWVLCACLILSSNIAEAKRDRARSNLDLHVQAIGERVKI